MNTQGIFTLKRGFGNKKQDTINLKVKTETQKKFIVWLKKKETGSRCLKFKMIKGCWLEEDDKISNEAIKFY